MKLKKILSATFAAMLLSSSLCFADVSTTSITETVMKTRCTDVARTSIYVKDGSGFTEYYSNRSGKVAVQEIAEALSGMEVEVYTPNRMLFNGLKQYGDVSEMKKMRIPGIDVYHFMYCPWTQRVN